MVGKGFAYFHRNVKSNQEENNYKTKTTRYIHIYKGYILLLTQNLFDAKLILYFFYTDRWAGYPSMPGTKQKRYKFFNLFSIDTDDFI